MAIHPPLVLNSWCSDKSVFAAIPKNKGKTAIYFLSEWSSSGCAPVGHKRQPTQPGNGYSAPISPVAKSATFVLLMLEIVEAASDRF